MAEVGAMHGDISTFNNVDGYLEAMFGASDSTRF